MIGARILLDSIAPSGARLTTFEVVLPRIVLAEFNTHRMFSRNSASSRAIPVEKMLKRVEEDPFTPFYWGKNQKGMQAEQELSQEEQDKAAAIWLHARKDAMTWSQALLDVGVHKQITNRLLEPWLWHTVIFTATELDNYFALRADKHAQPEIQRPTELLLDLYEDSEPMSLNAGEWHLPLVTGYEVHRTSTQHGTWKRPALYEADHVIDQVMITEEWQYWARVSAGRCARVSYLTHEGKRDLAQDQAMHDNLVTNGHMSPLEHPAQALTAKDWENVARIQAMRWIKDRVPMGNFWGWHQYRKLIPHEHNFELTKRM